MTTETLADQIQRVRQRLADIEEERAAVAPDDFSRKADLTDEERTLDARLAELRDLAAQELGGTTDPAGSPSRQIDITESANGKASGYERVPNDDQELSDTDGDQR